MITAVIFDMDGVIVNSEPTHIKIETSLIEKYRGHLTPNYLDKFCGTTDDYFWKTVIKEMNLPITPEKISEEKSKLFLEKIPELNLFEGVKELLDKLKKKDIKIALASSSQQAWINKIVELNQLNFEVIISGENIENSKPNPDIFLETAKQLNLSPQNCLVVEDAINGVKAAKVAQMKCLAVTNTFSKDKLKEADYIVSNLKEFDFTWLK